MNVINDRRPVRLETTYPRRFIIVIKWDSRADHWLAFTPELGLPVVTGATRERVIESVKEAARSFIDQAAAGGPSIPPDDYKEILEVEVEVPLRRIA